jgi:hypothetical protein
MRALKELIKTIVLVACLIWVTNEVFFARPAHAADATSSVLSTSSFKGADNTNVYVTSWVDHGVKCTVITAGDKTAYKNIQASVSCVKL